MTSAPRDWRLLRRTAAHLGMGLGAWVGVGILAVYGCHQLTGCVSAGYHTSQKETRTAAGDVTVEKRRDANYIDTTGAAQALGAVLDTVDWKGLIKDYWPLLATGLGGTGVVGTVLTRLHASHHQSKGRAQVRNAKAVT